MSVSCATSIGSIKEDPGYYDGERTTVGADVIITQGIPSTDFRLYLIGDDENSMFVVSSKALDENASERDCFTGTVYVAMNPESSGSYLSIALSLTMKAGLLGTTGGLVSGLIPTETIADNVSKLIINEAHERGIFPIVMMVEGND